MPLLGSTTTDGQRPRGKTDMGQIHVIVEAGAYTLEGYVQEDDDLDGDFILIEDVTMKPIMVHGYNCDIYVE
jgi:hypothetical protein